MPKLKETDWDKLVDNISIISFLQGLNIGAKIYNGYSVITNTKNKEVVTEDSIYILARNEENVLYYYRPTDEQLKKEELEGKGILNIDLERKTARNASNAIVEYYPISAFGSYSSIVSQDGITEENLHEYLKKAENREIAQLYYTALARERYGMYRTENDYEKLKTEY